MRTDEIKSSKVPNPLVECGRSLQVREQEGEARDLEPLIHVKGVGSVDVSEGLVAEQALSRKEGATPLHQSV